METCYKCKWAILEYIEDGSIFWDGCDREENYDDEQFAKDLIGFWDRGYERLPEKYHCFEERD